MIRRATCVQFLMFAALAGACVDEGNPSDDPDPSEVDTGVTEQAVSCNPTLAVYPVRGRHNHGYDSQAGNSSLWSCDDARSNSDFVAGDHLGNDIWAPEGTPVAATISGTLTLVGWSDGSGNKVTIADNCGYYHFYAHLKSIAPGMTNGRRVNAGDIIGTVGKTGTLSNGVVHLHYSIYPAGNYNAGRDPWPYTHPVEHGVCSTPAPVADAPEKLVAARNADGRLEVFWIAPGGAIMHAWQTSPGGAWSGGGALGGAAKELAVGTNASGRLELVYVGTNDLLHRRSQGSDGWGPEIALGLPARDVAVGRNSDGRLEIIYADGEDDVSHLWQTSPGGAWSGHTAFGGKARDLTVGNNADGRLEFFYVGTNGYLYHRAQVTDGWSGELSYGVVGREVAIGHNSDGRLELIYSDGEDDVSHTWQTAPNSGWSGTTEFGGKAKELAVGNNADGRLEFFYVGTNNSLYHRVQVTGGWSAELSVGVEAHDVAVARNADGRLEVFFAGSGGALRHMWQTAPNSGWSGAAPLDGTVAQ